MVSSDPQYFTAHGEQVPADVYPPVSAGCTGVTMSLERIIAPVPKRLRELGRVGCVAVVSFGGVSCDITVDGSGKVFLERPGCSTSLRQGVTYEIGRNTKWIGDNLPRTVSRHHAILTRGAGGLRITDQSLNGTKVLGAVRDSAESPERPSASWRAAVAERDICGEPAYVCDEDRGVFGGAGDEVGGYAASRHTRNSFQTERLLHTIPRVFRCEPPQAAEAWLVRTLEKASSYCEEDTKQELTVARLVEHEDGQAFAWVSTGHAQLYVVRDGVTQRMAQCEDDSGQSETDEVIQKGWASVMKGDMIVLVATNHEELTNENELGARVKAAQNPDEAARNIINISSKYHIDTAIVIGAE